MNVDMKEQLKSQEQSEKSVQGRFAISVLQIYDICLNQLAAIHTVMRNKNSYK
jgi:hypothetical protein